MKSLVQCLITEKLVVRSVLVVGTELFNISNWILRQTCSATAYWLHWRVCIHLHRYRLNRLTEKYKKKHYEYEYLLFFLSFQSFYSEAKKGVTLYIGWGERWALGPVWFLKCKMLTPAQCVGSEQVSGHLSLTVSVTKELRSPVEQKAKSINLRGTPAPPPPLPPRHMVSCYPAYFTMLNI